VFFVLNWETRHLNCTYLGDSRSRFDPEISLHAHALLMLARAVRWRRYSERCWLRTSCHARLSTRAIQVMPVSRQPVSEVLDMRKVDDAFSDSLKTPCNMIPI
jgi:hypothetical protein